MNASIIVLLGYISWTLVLLLALASYRHLFYPKVANLKG